MFGPQRKNKTLFLKCAEIQMTEQIQLKQTDTNMYTQLQTKYILHTSLHTSAPRHNQFQTLTGMLNHQEIEIRICLHCLQENLTSKQNAKNIGLLYEKHCTCTANTLLVFVHFGEQIWQHDFWEILKGMPTPCNEHHKQVCMPTAWYTHMCC